MGTIFAIKKLKEKSLDWVKGTEPCKGSRDISNSFILKQRKK